MPLRPFEIVILVVAITGVIAAVTGLWVIQIRINLSLGVTVLMTLLAAGVVCVLLSFLLRHDGGRAGTEVVQRVE